MRWCSRSWGGRGGARRQAQRCLHGLPPLSRRPLTRRRYLPPYLPPPLTPPPLQDSFGNSSLFHKALKEAFESFCNKQVCACCCRLLACLARHAVAGLVQHSNMYHRFALP